MHLAMAGRLTGPVTKWVVVVLWLLVVAGAYPFASRLVEVQNNEATSWLPAEAESVQALERLRSFQDVDDIPTTVVYHRDGGLTAADYATMASQAEELADLRGVVTPPDGRPPVVVPPDPVTGQQLGLVSADGEVATVLLTFNLGAQGWNDLPAVTDELREIAVLEGGEVHLAGAGGEAADAAAAFGGIDGKLLLAALGVVILILLFTYRSPVLWILPILSAVVALFTAQGIVYFLAKYADLTVNGQSQAILSVLVIGAGTDYALLLVARYREELRRHEDRHEAMAFALHRAAPAIVASAATVAVGMLCLLLAEMSSTAGLGPVAAIGVAVTLVVMLTLLPALLVVCGRWVFWPYRPGFGSHEPTTTGRWARLGAWIARRPRPVWVGTSLALGVACLGLVTMNVGTVPADEQYTQEFDSVTGQRLLVAHGLADTSSPVHVVASADHAEQVVTAIGTVDGLGTVQTAIPPVDGVKLISITQEADPASPEAVAEVEAVRGAVQAVPGADAQVTGTAALFLDSERASMRDSLLIIPLVLLVVMLILMVLLRAVLAPVLLILTVVLSFGAALGISTLVFHGLAQVLDEGAGFELVGSAFPLFTFVFLVALGIDYNIFLMTRVREETATRGTREGSLVALASTGGVITSAGLVLAATFAVLGTLPLVFLAQMGITVALGVMLDTMVVRSVLVTAINLDLGGRIWWPGRLDRAQPAAEVMPGRHVGTGTA